MQLILCKDNANERNENLFSNCRVQLILCKDSIKGGDYKMKMGFLLKNNARRGMGEEGVLKKGEEKEYSKRERKRRQKKAFKIREF